MKIEEVNKGFIKLNDDTLRVEAPVKERDKPGQPGRKLRVHIGRPDEPEPTVWHFYKWDGERFALVKDSFNGSKDEAVAACLAEFGEGN